MATWPGAFFFVADNPDHQVIELCRRALTRLTDDDPMRVHVLATLASHVTYASEPAERVALVDEALHLAERHGDPALRGAVLNAELMCRWEPATLERRERIAPELALIGRSR